MSYLFEITFLLEQFLKGTWTKAPLGVWDKLKRLSGVFLLLFLLLICSSYAQAQSLEDENDELSTEQSISEGESDETVIDNIERTEIYESLINQPLDINTATADDFAKIPFLNSMQIDEIIQYREKNGSFVSVNELNAITSLSEEEVRNLIPYCTANPITKEEQKPFRAKHVFESVVGTMFPKMEGFKAIDDSSSSNKFLCLVPLKSRVRYSFMGINSEIRFLAENDYGEPYFNSGNKAFDYLSAGYFYHSKNWLKALTIGDYTARFGQGLAMWNGYASSFSTTSEGAFKDRSGLAGYSSFNESQYLRGVGTTFKVKNIGITAFGSYKAIDASIILTDSLNTEKSFGSFINTGIHALPADMEKKHALHESTGGVNILWQNEYIVLGALGTATKYDAVKPASDDFYKRFAFTGNSISNASTYYRVNTRRIRFYGETAMAKNYSLALLHGIAVNPASEICFSLMYRYYDKSYYAPYANAFGQQSLNVNEHGWYAGIDIQPFTKYFVSLFADITSYPWLKYRTSEPSYSSTYYFQVKRIFDNGLNLSARYTAKYGMQDSSGTIPVKHIIDYTTQRARLEAKYSPNEWISITNRAEWVWYNEDGQSKQSGFAMLQDICWKPMQERFYLQGRLAWFNTDSYDARIYAIERGAGSYMSIPVYYGKGLRYVVSGKLKLSKRMNAQIHYSSTHYFDRTTLGQGGYAIDGSDKNEIVVACKLRL
ncbi:MAG TPA: helix-hairpin-helix domain-containing protein [Bacteroidales bacterium]